MNNEEKNQMNANTNKAIQMHVDDEDKRILDFKGFSHFGADLWRENDFSK
jgi:hypothetical protein